MTTPSEPTVSELLNGIITDLEKAFANLTVDETKACAPAFISFFTWLEANPGAVMNPVAIGPKLMILKLSLLSAQSTVTTEEVKSLSGNFVTLFQTMLTQANSIKA
jgi:hypothetical protein